MNQQIRKCAANAAIQAILCGQENTVRAIPYINQPSPKEMRHLRRKLDADEQWQLAGDQVYNASGGTFQGSTSWVAAPSLVVPPPSSLRVPEHQFHQKTGKNLGLKTSAALSRRSGEKKALITRRIYNGCL